MQGHAPSQHQKGRKVHGEIVLSAYRNKGSHYPKTAIACPVLRCSFQHSAVKRKSRSSRSAVQSPVLMIQRKKKYFSSFTRLISEIYRVISTKPIATMSRTRRTSFKSLSTRSIRRIPEVVRHFMKATHRVVIGGIIVEYITPLKLNSRRQFVYNVLHLVDARGTCV